MCLDACGMKFFDSLNYFNTSLAKLPQLFGLSSLNKAYFPHLFSTEKNQHYKGEISEASYYDLDGMKPDNSLCCKRQTDEDLMASQIMSHALGGM